MEIALFVRILIYNILYFIFLLFRLNTNYIIMSETTETPIEEQPKTEGLY